MKGEELEDKTFQEEDPPSLLRKRHFTLCRSTGYRIRVLT